MTTRNWMMWVSAIGCSSSLWACGSGGDAPAPVTSTAGNSTGGTSAGGGAAGAASGGVGGAGAANGGAGGGSAGTAGAGAGGCTPLMPTGTVHQLVISEVVPGTGIEVFNPGTTAVPLANVWFCSQFDYEQAPAANGQTEVPPGGYVALSWPDDYTGLAAASGGEMLMMINADGVPTPETTQSYLCWGNHTGGRKGDVTSGADLLYLGDCAPALTAGSISRVPGTDGLGAASYDTASAPSLVDCP